MSTPFPARLDAFLQANAIRHFQAAEICPVGKTTRHRKTGAAVALQEAPQHLWPNALCALWVADWLRERAGVPVGVTSGYRDPRYNAAVGGEDNSLHLAMGALDLHAFGRVTPAELHRLLESHPLAKLFGIGRYATFVHLDVRGAFGRPAPARW